MPWRRFVKVEPDEGISAVSLAGWATVLLAPVHLFNKSPALRVMSDTAPEYIWGAVAFAIVGIFAVSVIVHHWLARVIALAFMAAWWLLVATMIFVSTPTFPGYIVYSTIAVSCLLRISAEAALHD